MDVSAQELLRDRVRDALATPAEEKRMFGGLGFMVEGRLAVFVGKDATLLVRVSEDRSEELQQRAGVHVATMGERSMGPGWLRVDAATAADDDELDHWVGEALAHRRRESAS